MVLCIGIGVTYKIYSEKKEKRIYRESYNNYIANLDQAQALMVTGGSDAESLCNLTAKVWKNAIYENRDSETDKYTRPDGYFVSSFNKAIENLYSNTDTKESVTKIKSNQGSVKDLIKKMQDPPKGLDKCYDTVTDLYETYKILTDLAISPLGNYNEFNTKKIDAVSDFMSAYEKLDNQTPEKMKYE